MNRRLARLMLGTGLCVSAAWLIADRQGLRDQLFQADASSPYQWCDRAEEFARANDTSKAKYCFQRAMTLGPAIPPVWMRAANFDLATHNVADMRVALARVLSLTGEYDSLIFTYLESTSTRAAEFMPLLKGDLRGANAFFHYLIEQGPSKAHEAAQTWEWLRANTPTDDRLAADYIAYLLHNGLLHQAAVVSPRHDAVLNGGFETEFNGSDLDWKINSVAGVETLRDDSVAKEGRFSLKIHYAGTHNTDQIHAAQLVVLNPGEYRLRAWVKSEGITTDQGIRLQAMNATTDQLRGTNDWTLLQTTFTVPKVTSLVRIEIRRDGSSRFDNKINGVAWVDSVSVESLAGRPPF